MQSVNFPENLTIGVVWSQKDRLDQTFIKAHVNRLPGNKKVFHGGHFPQLYNSKPIFSFSERSQRFFYKVFKRSFLEDVNARSLAKFLTKEKIDVMLAEFGMGGVGVMHACHKAQIPLVVHFHGIDAYGESYITNYGTAYQTLFKIAKGIVAVSQDMKKQLEKLGSPSQKVFCNPCGVDTNFFKGASPQQAGPVFLGVARFVEKKGHFATLVAFQKVLKDCPDANLVLIGVGPLLEACQALSRTLKISHAVNFLGLVAPDKVLEWMKKARCFVQHSLCAANGDAEGTPVAILEAGSCSLPVVSTRHKGIQEAVVHEQTGFLVEEGDIESMAKYMLILAQEPRLAVELGQNARTWVIENYSQEKSINNLYKILLNAKNPAFNFV